MTYRLTGLLLTLALCAACDHSALAEGSALTRQGAVEHLMEGSAPAYPAPDAHLILTDNASALVPSEGCVELLPPMDSRYQAQDFVRLVDGVVVDKTSVLKQPTFPATRVPAWTGGLHKKVQLAYITDDSKYRLLLEATLHSRLSDALPTFTVMPQGEDLTLQLSGRNRLRAAYLYEGTQCLGQLDKSADAFLVHTRFLAPGRHALFVIAQTQEGVLLPPYACPCTVPTRYKIATPERATVVDEHDEHATATIRIALQGSPAVVSTQVYVEGALVATSDRPDFPVTVPLRDIPSGEAIVEVVGKSADGMAYTAESAVFPVQNHEWTLRLGQTEEYQRLQEALRQIQELEADAVVWYEKARHEPAFVEDNVLSVTRGQDVFGQSYSMSTLTILRTPGKTGEYIGYCRQDLLKMGPLWLEAGDIYQTLKASGRAKHAYEATQRTAGADSPTSLRAAVALRHLSLLQ